MCVKAEELQPSYASGHEVLGDIFDLEGNAERAKSEWRTALKTARNSMVTDLRSRLDRPDPHASRVAR